MHVCLFVLQDGRVTEGALCRIISSFKDTVLKTKAI